MPERILLAGATGHLGRALGPALVSAGYNVRALVRQSAQEGSVASWADEVVCSPATDRAALKGAARGVDAVISAIGITLQNDGMSYEDVDFGANRNLLEEALAQGVGRFAYVASLGGDRLRALPLTAAKEKFVDALRAAPIRHTILRPNGLFHDFDALLGQAFSGSIALVGDGSARLNPISERDAALRIVAALSESVDTVSFGGPDVLNWREIAETCIRVADRPVNLVSLDPGKIAATVAMLPWLTPESVHGALSFHLTMMAQDNLGPGCGSDRLGDWLAARASAMGGEPGEEDAA